MRFSLTRSGVHASITFDDGGMNLLSGDALRELREVIRELDSSPETGVVTFRSSRPSLFAAGADMAEMQRFGAIDALEFSRLGQETFAAIERLPAITVAEIDGDCFGGALDLVLAFGLRRATPRSRFSHPGSRLGIVTGFGGTSRWRGVLPAPAARSLFLGNEVLDAARAATIGLVDVVADTTDLETLVTADRAASRFLKELARYAGGRSRREIMRMGEILAAVHGLQ